MKTEKKIMRTLIDSKESLTIRQLSKAIKADYRITHTAARRLADKNILLTKTIGKSTLCTLNPDYYGKKIYEVEEERKTELLKNRNLSQLHKELLSKIGTSLFICLVFGSHAKASSTRHSDIDLMFISNEEDFEKEVDSILSLLPLKTHAFVFTEEEFRRMLHSREQNVVKEAARHNVILFGTESYYRLRNA